MSNSHEPTKGSPDEFPAPAVSLAHIQQRRQIDFEIEFYQDVINDSPFYTDVLVQLGQLFTLKNMHQEALQVDRRLAVLKPADPMVAYNLACSQALLGQTSEAIKTLRHAIQIGYLDVEHMLHDPDLGNLHETPEYLQLIEELDIEDLEP